jgi:uncharacterized membrane protein YqhA
MAQGTARLREGVDAPSISQTAETFFEQVLWQSRLVMLVGVVASILMALALLYVAAVDTLYAFRSILTYGAEGLDPGLRSAARVEVITGVIKAADSYLIAAILLLFGLGLYELFINHLNAADRSEVAPRLLVVRSLDDLKDRIAKLILLVLIIELFQYALRLNYTAPQDLLVLSVTILLVGIAMYVSSLKTRDKQTPPPSHQLPAADPTMDGSTRK